MTEIAFDISFWILLVFIIVNSVYIYILNKRLKNTVKYFLKKLSEVRVDSKISSIFSGNADEGHEDVHALANNLFNTVKNTFGLHAKSYAEMASELHHLQKIDQDLKDALVNFFDEMIVIEYKDENLTASQKEDLRAKMKIIFEKLPTTNKV